MGIEVVQYRVVVGLSYVGDYCIRTRKVFYTFTYNLTIPRNGTSFKICRYSNTFHVKHVW
jgi:hypothetical protein